MWEEERRQGGQGERGWPDVEPRPAWLSSARRLCVNPGFRDLRLLNGGRHLTTSICSSIPMPQDGHHQQQQPYLTEEEVTEAALNLATSSRDFLGLPSELHSPDEAASSSPTTPWQPPLLPSPPTALELLQRLQAGTAPFLIAGALTDRSRLQQWMDNEYLRRTMAGREVKVACTPDGKADDIKTGPLGDKWVFALPEERSM